jgi:hypothetical protein
MRSVVTACCAFILALIIGFTPNLYAQAGPPVFRSPADAGRTSRYRSNLIKYNEAWAVRIVWTLHSAQATYQATVGNGNYGTLEELSKEKLINLNLADGQAYGYRFRIRTEKLSSESPAAFEIVAIPRKYGRTGRRSFYVNETGAMVAADKKGAEANASDDPLDP